MQADAFFPLLLIAAAILLVGKRWRGNAWMDRLAVAALAVVVLRYLHWRLFVTVLPVDIPSVTGVFVWTVFLIELLVWVDAAILYAYLLRRTDRTPEADAHEARLRGLDPQELSEVDVFIATYNESPEVLERTIVGAAAMDWPEARLNVWVLDDGRRNWLRHMAEDLGVGYLTRADNAHAKAGNINAAVARTSAPFFLVLDADFIPQRNFLYRTMGFFRDPKIGIVQIPHNFFNPDPMQSSLNLSKVMPDDQRFFFEAIMPGRDGYDCAFCCGSNGVVRRSALQQIGNKLPSGSITEDMLLTIALKRKGYITRYLDERLAFGLAPENVNAFFIQRARWARGAIQIMFLKDGPLGGGPGLKLHERLFFLPLHWITQSFGQTLAMATPAIFLLTGVAPLVNATTETVLSYQLPAIIAAIACVRHFAPGEYHPLASTAHGILQAIRLLPVVATTLLKPHGHAFKVTPKDGDGAGVQDTATVTVCLLLCALMALGLFINSSFSLQIVPFPQLLPIVAFWSVVNMVLLLLVAKIATTPPMLRSEERFELRETVRLHMAGGSIPAESRDMSLSGVMLELDADLPAPLDTGSWLGVEIAGVGVVPGQIRRIAPRAASGTCIGLSFGLPIPGPTSTTTAVGASHDPAWNPAAARMRQRLICKLFTQDLARKFDDQHGWEIGIDMLRSIVAPESAGNGAKVRTRAAYSVPPPAWLQALQLQDETALDDEWNRVAGRSVRRDGDRTIPAA